MSFDINYVARLARIQLSAEEAARLQGQLSDVLEYVNQLKQVDVTGVEPTAHAIPVENAFRADEVKPSLDRDDVLGNAPSHSDDQFLVPKIIE
jgi:aspartyl-tRNA(Asn)/glutamyl-tRNA(Gln) amidotransferase subunit C